MDEKRCPRCGSPLIVNETTNELWHVWIATKECPDPNAPAVPDTSKFSAKIEDLEEKMKKLVE